ncbi:alkaline phosphatase D family protein [Aquabacterium sp. J223]|uniref:alkaline phosphatase D family protein n=1 Tax=Aquabacterium sp. J223 TaxID=2898431 RepID=UPI0021AE313A|nr:alkaline phosphatase D family protein [Aquabacterium sp. J223]UUX95782.1 alkaline phosphatase D family protein [Aquabacterium sp. J223]UUX95794.1 alkaline phosphatase D family protein [Aquabacterium sp. J223]
MDDHEIRDDWFNGLRNGRDDSANDTLRREAAFGCLMAGLGGGVAADRFWYSFETSGFRFAVLDLRTERMPPGGRIWSRTQRDWFQSWLAASADHIKEGRPLFVAGSIPVFPFNDGAGSAEDLGRGDGWSAYPDSLAEFFSLLLKAKVPRLVLLAGNPHLSHVAQGTLADAGHSMSVVSVVASALNAPLPSMGTPRGAIQASLRPAPGSEPGSGPRLSYTTRTQSDEDCACVVEVAGASDGTWTLVASFVGLDGTPPGDLTAVGMTTLVF